MGKKMNLFKCKGTDDVFEGYTYDFLRENLDLRTYEYSHLDRTFSFQDRRLLNWIGSVDSSGYVREKCLRELIEQYQSGDENRILLRLTDWVQEVRLLAEGWFIEHFRELPVRVVKENEVVLNYVLRRNLFPSVMREIRLGLLEHTFQMGECVFRALSQQLKTWYYQHGLAEYPVLRAWCLYDPNPRNRLRLFGVDLQGDLKPEEEEVLASDPSTGVQSRYVQWRHARERPLSEKELLALVVHKSLSIRALGRYWLKKQYGVDAIDVYRSFKDDRKFLLADFANKEDVEVFEEGVFHSSSRIRLLCLKALLKTDKEKLVALGLNKLLQDKNGKFRKTLITSLPAMVGPEDLKAFRPVILQAHSNGCYLYLSMLYRASYWLFLEEFLERYSEMPDKVRSVAKNWVLSKTNFYMRPNLERISRLRILLGEIEKDRGIPDSHLANRIRFMLDHACLPLRQSEATLRGWLEPFTAQCPNSRANQKLIFSEQNLTNGIGSGVRNDHRKIGDLRGLSDRKRIERTNQPSPARLRRLGWASIRRQYKK